MQPNDQDNPSQWRFELKFQRGETIYDPSADQIASGLRSLRVVEYPGSALET